MKLLAAAVMLAALALTACGGGATPSTKGSSDGSVFVQTQTAQSYTLTLRVAPVTFGANTFTLTVKNVSGAPVSGASAHADLEMLDMDMGVQTANLQPAGTSAPGVYSGQGELSMAGHWLVKINMTPSGAGQPITADYHLTVSYD